MINSLSLCARINLNLHNLNNEGTEGNQQMTRMVHILDENGNRCVVNAISGDMFKHIFVGHLTPILDGLGQTVCENSRNLHPDRILLDPEFQKQVARKDISAEEIQDLMITGCAVTDIAGTLYATKAVARKSTVEFGWVVGIPEVTRTEQYFHVKYDPSRTRASGGETVAGTQAIFHRPASSGTYALVSHLELARIGVNDVVRRPVISEDDRKERMRAAIVALAHTLAAPRGAQLSTQFPHITEAQGVITVSTNSVPAPTFSPLKSNFREEIRSIAEQLNSMSENTRSEQSPPISVYEFESLHEALEIINRIAGEIT